MGVIILELNFRVIVKINGAKSLHFDRFKVNDLEYAIDPTQEAVKYGF
jgi:hypothetical protein